jgi:hypothetical protein
MKPKYKSASNSQSDLKKFYPYIKSNKRLTIVLEDCKDVQNTLKEMRKNMSYKSAKNQNLIKNIQTGLDKDFSIQFFKQENEKRKMKLKNDKNDKITDIQKKIDSLLKSPKIGDKHRLKRLERKDIASIPERIIIGPEEIKSEEAKEILLNNKRNFGEHFNKETITPTNKKLKKALEKKIPARTF